VAEPVREDKSLVKHQLGAVRRQTYDLVLLADLCMLFFIRQHSGPSPPRYASQSERRAIFRESVSNVGRHRFVVDVLGILEHAHSTLDFVRARRIPLRPRIFNAIPHGRKRTAEI
jgi:hypothetical protein